MTGLRLYLAPDACRRGSRAGAGGPSRQSRSDRSRARGVLRKRLGDNPYVVLLGVALLAFGVGKGPTAMAANGAEPAKSDNAKTHFQFVTLGTGGGPRVQTNRSQPANAIVVGQDVYLFDVGEGTQRQLKAAGIELAHIKGLFISHHHIDHVGGLWPLLVNRWVQGVYDPLPIYGPPGTTKMVAGLMAAARAVELVPVSLAADLPTIAQTVKPIDMASEMEAPTAVFNRTGVRVLAILNDHYHFAPHSEAALSARSYAFRIEAGNAAVVYSGDTGPSRRLEILAKNADLLVSEVIDMEAIRSSLEKADMPESLREGVMKHLSINHVTPRQVGAMARRANVRMVALTHLVPGLDTDQNDTGYVAGLVDEFHGPVVVARDGQRFDLSASENVGD